MKSLWKRSFVKFYIVYIRLRGYRYLRSERRIRKKKIVELTMEILISFYLNVFPSRDLESIKKKSLFFLFLRTKQRAKERKEEEFRFFTMLKRELRQKRLNFFLLIVTT